MPPEVTAVITTHVRPDAVHEALASVRAETHEDLEIVVVDDGGAFEPSTDGRAVRVVRGEALGVGRARNLGLDAARGEFVIFLDDDDVALPHRIARLTAAARGFQADLCFGMTRRVVEGAAIPLPSVPTHVVATGCVGFRDVLTCAPHVNAVLTRTATLRAVGGFDADAQHFDEWSAWLRIADSGAVIRSIDDVVAEWRLHAHGLSAQVLHIRAMSRRLSALFARLEPVLTRENARAVAEVRRRVEASDITTYDDYVAVAAACFRDAFAPNTQPLAPRIAHA